MLYNFHEYKVSLQFNSWHLIIMQMFIRLLQVIPAFRQFCTWQNGKKCQVDRAFYCIFLSFFEVQFNMQQFIIWSEALICIDVISSILEQVLAVLKLFQFSPSIIPTKSYCTSLFSLVFFILFCKFHCNSVGL